MQQEETILNIATLKVDVVFLKERTTDLSKKIDLVCSKLDNLKYWIMAIMAGEIFLIITHSVK